MLRSQLDHLSRLAITETKLPLAVCHIAELNGQIYCFAGRAAAQARQMPMRQPVDSHNHQPGSAGPEGGEGK